MASLVRQFQADILSSQKPVTELLRMAKLISAKLGLGEIEEWIGHELSGYPTNSSVPPYRLIGGVLQARNPYQGWITVTNGVTTGIPCVDAVSQVEEHAAEKFVYIAPHKNVPLSAGYGMDDLVSSLPQRVLLSGTEFKKILEAIKDKLVDWSIELERRGIVGEDMSFDEREKQAAHNQTFHIQSVTGIVGNVTGSQVTVYDYSSVHQILKDAGVPRDARNEIEDIMDGLKSAAPAERKSWTERGKEWVVKNEKFLGASASIILKALGANSSTGE